MRRLFITADIHGSVSAWMAIKNLLTPEDSLIIAGDLFDTKYGNYSDPDFQPEFIKKDISCLKQPLYFVYGNCDVPSFFPGHCYEVDFMFFGKKIFVHHGNNPKSESGNADIIIQGHSHAYLLKKTEGRVIINPGSIARPRNGVCSYSIIDKRRASIVELKTGKSFLTIDL